MRSGKRRKNHEGTFRQLPSGRWEGAQRVAGIDRPVYVTGDTEAKARKALAEKTAAILSNQTLPRTSKVTFKVYAEQVIRERGGIGQRTREKYSFELNNYLVPLHERKIASITASEIRALYAGMRERNLSVAVVGHAHALLNIIFNTAKVDKVIAQNPLDGARLRPKALKGEQKEPTVYLPDQARLILKYAPRVIHGEAIALLLLTGMRRGEALALRWTDVDWEKKTLNISKTRSTSGSRVYEGTPKTDSSRRVVPLADETLRLLRMVRAVQLERHKMLTPHQPEPTYVVTNLNGTPVRPDNIWKRMRQVQQLIEDDLISAERQRAAGENRPSKEIRFPRHPIHALRHTFVSVMADQGESLENIAEWIGDHPATVRQVYHHRFRRAVEIPSLGLGGFVYTKEVNQGVIQENDGQMMDTE